MKHNSTISQFIRFGLVGISNTLVNYVIYAGCIFGFEKAGIFRTYDYIAAQTIAFLVSVLWAFLWNRKMVFTDREELPFWKTLLKTYISYAFTGLFLSNVLLTMWINLFHISKMAAPLLNLIVTVPLNFILNKFWAFR